MANLSNVHVAVLVTEGFEQPELTEPVKALRDAGAVVDIISEKRGPVRGFKHHDPGDSVDATMAFDEAQPDRYDGLLLPGGAINADYIRALPQAQRFVKAFDDAGKPMAVICHAPWLLIDSGVVQGRTVTSWPSIKTDLKNAGANWVDREVNVDGNLVTSRKPDDIPAFNREFMRLIEESKGAQSGQHGSRAGAAQGSPA
jgi:protease I